LKRIFILCEEMQQVLHDAKPDMKAKFSYVRFLISLSFLVGIFESVNWINLVLQGIQISVLHCHETLVAFKMKLELWHAKLEKKFVLQWTWTELTEFFLQKTKRKKRKLPYGESDMKIGCGVRYGGGRMS
ncbi:hypothetical protein T4B_2538, partial [Trichinella pseudospiralis]